jgi:hypothetical protein
MAKLKDGRLACAMVCFSAPPVEMAVGVPATKTLAAVFPMSSRPAATRPRMVYVPMVLFEL